jgi:hypothetical protein
MVQFSSLYSARLDRELGTDDASVLFTTARRKAAVNEGATEFANLTGILTRWVTFTGTGGTAEYDLNSTTIIPDGDFGGFAKEPVEFRYVDASSNVIELSGRCAAQTRHSVARPVSARLAAVDRGELRHAAAGKLLRADGRRRLLPRVYAGSVDGFECELHRARALHGGCAGDDQRHERAVHVRGCGAWRSLPYHQGVVHYAAHQLEKLRRDDQASDRQLQKFLGYVSRCLQDMGTRGPKAIRQARNYFASRINDRPVRLWASGRPRSGAGAARDQMSDVSRNPRQSRGRAAAPGAGRL